MLVPAGLILCQRVHEGVGVAIWQAQHCSALQFKQRIAAITGVKQAVFKTSGTWPDLPQS
jgi:hypothetical protein